MAEPTSGRAGPEGPPAAVLERAGLITRGREAQWRPCRLEADPLREVADWVEGYRRFWEESERRYERLDNYLRKAQRKGAEP
jgi:DNA-binding transcriptional ArsR family regulator